MNSFLPVLAAISSGSLINLLITILVVGVIFWLIHWAISAIPVPQPFAKILQVILILAAVIFLINALAGLLGRNVF